MRKRWLLGTAVAIGLVAAGTTYAAPRLLERLSLQAHANGLSLASATMQRSYFADALDGRVGSRACERLRRAVRLANFAIENQRGIALAFDPSDLHPHALDGAEPEWTRSCRSYEAIRDRALLIVLSLASDDEVRNWLADAGPGAKRSLNPARACRAYGRMIPYFSLAREDLIADVCAEVPAT